MLHKVEALNLFEVREHGLGHEGLREHVLHDFDTEAVLLHRDLGLCDLQGLLLSVAEPGNESLLLLKED